MPDRLELPSCPFRFGIALAAVLLVLGAAAESRAEKAALERCKSEWNDSPASAACTFASIAAVGEGGDDCEISATCPTSDGGNRTSSITVDVDSVSGLNNCDGELTDGSC